MSIDLGVGVGACLTGYVFVCETASSTTESKCIFLLLLNLFHFLPEPVLTSLFKSHGKILKDVDVGE